MTIPYTTYKILLKIGQRLLNVRTKIIKLLGKNNKQTNKKQEKIFMTLDLAVGS